MSLMQREQRTQPPATPELVVHLPAKPDHQDGYRPAECVRHQGKGPALRTAGVEVRARPTPAARQRGPGKQ